MILCLYEMFPERAAWVQNKHCNILTFTSLYCVLIYISLVNNFCGNCGVQRVKICATALQPCMWNDCSYTLVVSNGYQAGPLIIFCVLCLKWNKVLHSRQARAIPRKKTLQYTILTIPSLFSVMKFLGYIYISWIMCSRIMQFFDNEQ